MKKVANPDDLIAIKERIRSGSTSEGNKTGKVRIRVHMGTSGLASGAKEIYEFFNLELEKRNIDAVTQRTGDMGYCFAEPTIEVTLPGQEPVVFGYVDRIKADEIIEKYIKNGELVEGILPMNYQTIS